MRNASFVPSIHLEGMELLALGCCQLYPLYGTHCETSFVQGGLFPVIIEDNTAIAPLCKDVAKKLSPCVVLWESLVKAKKRGTKFSD